MVGGPQMNGMRPPSSHPGQPFNGQMTPQMMAARQAQAAQGGPGMQWPPGGPNGNQIGPPGGPPGQQVQTTPQQRSMPPPSAPAGVTANQRNQTASPQTTTVAPPTPQQSTKANPKKKENKNSKSKVNIAPPQPCLTTDKDRTLTMPPHVGCHTEKIKCQPQCGDHPRGRASCRGRAPHAGHSHHPGQPGHLWRQAWTGYSGGASSAQRPGCSASPSSAGCCCSSVASASAELRHRWLRTGKQRSSRK